MIYREAPSGEPCASCESRTMRRCELCAKPQCERHLDGRSQCRLCAEAHELYDRGVQGRRLGAVALAAGIAVLPSRALGLSLATTFILLAIAAPLCLIWAEIWNRRAFAYHRQIRMAPRPLKIGETDERALETYQDERHDART